MHFAFDIISVFGTDDMQTFAKSIDAPVKLMFPYDWQEKPPAFGLLGLRDIVFPGAFIAICLRIDILKSLNKKEFSEAATKRDPERALKMI